MIICFQSKKYATKLTISQIRENYFREVDCGHVINTIASEKEFYGDFSENNFSIRRKNWFRNVVFPVLNGEFKKSSNGNLIVVKIGYDIFRIAINLMFLGVIAWNNHALSIGAFIVNIIGYLAVWGGTIRSYDNVINAIIN